MKFFAILGMIYSFYLIFITITVPGVALFTDTFFKAVVILLISVLLGGIENLNYLKFKKFMQDYEREKDNYYRTKDLKDRMNIKK